MCRHCKANKVSRPRGLCWSCYYRPGVRDRYPSTSKYASRGVGNGHHVHAPLPAEPTDATPGSEAKIRILEERARKCQALWHPEDSVMPAGRPCDTDGGGSDA